MCACVSSHVSSFYGCLHAIIMGVDPLAAGGSGKDALVPFLSMTNG